MSEKIYVPLGVVGWVADGDYNPNKEYSKGKWVSFGGGSYGYIYPTPSTGVPVTDKTHWQQIAEKGDKGDKGETGEQGIQGDTGEQGIQGDTGEQGIQGDKGDKGDKGEQGIQGDQGPQGIQGEQGVRGLTGEQGIQGDTGEQGIQGDNGVSAYTQATIGGYTGLLEDFYSDLASLQGLGDLLASL